MWFELSILHASTSDATWKRGMSLYRGHKVLSLAIQAVDGSQWTLSGKVQGTQRKPYTVNVDLTLETDGDVKRWRSLCTCPMDSQCKHGVALTLKAAAEGASLAHAALKAGPRKPPPAAPTAAEKAAEQTAKQAAQAAEKAAADERLAQLLAQQHAQRQQALRARVETAALHWLRKTDPAGTTPAAPAQGEHIPLYLLHVQEQDGGGTVLRMGVGLSTAKVRGGWTKPKQVDTVSALFEPRLAHCSPTDQELLQLLRGLSQASPRRYGHADVGDSVLHGAVGLMLLERAAATGRLVVKTPDGFASAPLTWGPPLSLPWQWTALPGCPPDDRLWRLQPQLPHPELVVCANTPVLYFDPVARVCGLLTPMAGQTQAQLYDLLHTPVLPQRLMTSNQADLLRQLGAGVPQPPNLPSIKQVGGAPVWRLHISRTATDEQDQAGLATAQLDFDYQGLQGWWGPDAANLLLEHHGAQVLLNRNLPSEQAAERQLLALGMTDWDEGVFVLPLGPTQHQWLAWADAQFDPLRQAGFEVTTDATLKGWVRHADGLQVQVQPHSDDEATSPWFDLSLGLELDGQRLNVLPWLPQLIHSLGGGAATAQGEQPPELPPHVFLPSPDGKGYIRMATEPLRPWLNALLELVGDRQTNFGGDVLKLSRLDTLRAHMSLGDGVAWQGASSLHQMAQQLSGRAELPTIALPAGLKAELRPYQHQGLNWLQFLRAHALGGILADDMGLGKTLQTLAHIQCEKEAGRLDRPVLVVAPVSLLGNWLRETQRFCPDLRALVLHGADRHERAPDMQQADVVIAPYSLLQRDRDRWLGVQWHTVVLDEAQNIKNAHTHAAQVVAEIDTRHRLCLSGTPMENHLGEVWSLFHFLMPGFLGSEQRFQKLFRQPIEKHADSQRMAQLRARIAPFMLRRTKDLVAHELPPKVHTVMRVELSGQQADLYETIRLGMEQTVRQALSDKGLAKSQITILDALLKLRQVCCDPGLVKLDAARQVTASAKLEQLMDILPEMLEEGRRVLLFSQFTTMLTRIETELAKRNISWVKLTGQTQKRDEVIERFTSGKVPLFLISLKAGGVGLNLPQADTVIHFDPWWNPAAENQATDRAHRIGQTHSVWVIKMVAQGTIEERILALQERKAELARDVYSGSASRKQPLFSENDLSELLKPLGAGA